jgi:hypothetical protein
MDLREIFIFKNTLHCINNENKFLKNNLILLQYFSYFMKILMLFLKQNIYTGILDFFILYISSHI